MLLERRASLVLPPSVVAWPRGNATLPCVVGHVIVRPRHFAALACVACHAVRACLYVVLLWWCRLGICHRIQGECQSMHGQAMEYQAPPHSCALQLSVAGLALPPRGRREVAVREAHRRQQRPPEHGVDEPLADDAHPHGRQRQLRVAVGRACMTNGQRSTMRMNSSTGAQLPRTLAAPSPNAPVAVAAAGSPQLVINMAK